MKKLNVEFCLLITKFMLHNWGEYINKRQLKFEITHKHNIENVWHMVISVYKKFWDTTVNTLDVVLLCKVVAKNRITQCITHSRIPTKHEFWEPFPNKAVVRKRIQ